MTAIEEALLRHGLDAPAGAGQVAETLLPYGDTPGGYRRRRSEDHDRTLCLLPATWWTSSSPPRRASGRSSPSTTAPG